MEGEGEVDSPSVQFLRFLAGLDSPDANTKIQSATSIRKLLSVQENPPLDEAIHAGVVVKAVNILSTYAPGQSVEIEKLMFELTWCLVNIGSGNVEHTEALVAQGGLEALLPILVSSADAQLKENVVWCFGNCASEIVGRDRLLIMGALPPMIEIYSNRHAPLALRRQTAWALSNIPRQKPLPPFQAILPYVNAVLNELLDYAILDQQILADSLWGMSYITDDFHGIESVLPYVAPIIDLLEHENSSVVTPALRVIGNIVTGTDQQTEFVVSAGVCPKLKTLLHNDRKAVVREACWAFSNITAGTASQIEKVIECGAMKDLLELTGSGTHFDIVKEALWSVSNSTSGGGVEIINTLMKMGMMDAFGHATEVCIASGGDVRIIAVVLSAIENILAAGVQEFEVNKYEQLVYHSYCFGQITEFCEKTTNSSLVDKYEEIMSNYLQGCAESRVKSAVI